MDPFLGQLIMFAGNFAPRGWAFCDGQLLAISNYQALFSILGTTYGGDGRSTFALPDLRGRVPIHPGSGPGLTTRKLGEKSGVENVTLTAGQLPSHSHGFNVESVEADERNPKDKMFGVGTFFTEPDPKNDRVLSQNAITPTGSNQAHTNMQPYQAVNYIICLQGIFPSRS